MSYFEALVLGLVQGLTEFIPVSSSGHLILFHDWFGSASTDLAFDAILQLATALAVLFYLRKDVGAIIRSGIRIIQGKMTAPSEQGLFWALVFGTIPAVVFGFFLESVMATTFRSVTLVAVALLVGSALMVIADRYKGKEKVIGARSGFFIGLFQSLALVPGISRSGATISGGLLQGLSREEATRFSFLLSFPIIAGSGIKKLLELSSAGDLFSLALGIGFITSFLSGLLAIHYLLRYLKTHSLSVFVYYRVVLAIVLLLFL